MKSVYCLIVSFILSPICFSQTVERKIIIQNNLFFYTTIDAEFQIATLHTDSLSRSLNSARKLALPAGRNYTQPVNPFSWDLRDSLMFAINFLNHPLNSKNEALKQFPLSSLREWSKDVTVMDMIMKGVEDNRFAYNDPYKFIKRQTHYLNGFFFDGIVLQDSIYVMAIANNDQLSIWNYANGKWTHGEQQSFSIRQFFSLVEKNKQLYIVLNNGNIHRVSGLKVSSTPEVITNKNLQDYLLVLNRDRNVVQLIKRSELNTSITFKELIEKKGIYIF
jgi:hypothetical protein